MREQPLRKGRHFVFEVELEINPTLYLAPGELATLLLDGLFALDEDDRLFPGATDPERILSASAMSCGHSRYSEPGRPPIRSAPSSDRPAQPRTEEDDGILINLNDAFFDIEKVLMEQRTLIFKIRGLEEDLRSSSSLSEADRLYAQKLLRASAALVKHHNRSTKLAL